MPFYERGEVRIRYEEVGSGFPLMLIPGGGLNSTIGGLDSGPNAGYVGGLIKATIALRAAEAIAGS